MDFLDLYLNAVKKYLPWQGQDDILAELRANLESQLEDQEAELGRPLSKAETEAWLKRIGSPIQVAAQYQRQQYLIGPAVFPIYWFVLRLALAWAVAIYAIANVVVIATGTPSWPVVLHAILKAPGVLVSVAAWITLAFAVIEFAVTRYPSKCQSILGGAGDWPANAFPAFEKVLIPQKKQRTYAHAVAELVFGVLFLAWLLLIPHYPYVLMGPGLVYVHVSPFQLAPVWIQFYWCVVALNIVQVAWRCVDLLRGEWQNPRPAQQIVVKVFGLIPLVLLLSSHVWVTLKNPVLDQAQYGGTVASINQGTHLALTLVCAIVILQLAWEIGRVGLDTYRRRVAARR